MVNGSPIEPFNLEKGLRQGDLISSFLFTIVSESLTFVIKEAQARNMVGGFQIGNDEVKLTHLQFTDDTLLFIPKNTEKLINYKRLLQYYDLMTGLDLNFSKSSLFS